MQKVDRLGWAAGFSFLAYGLLVGVRSNETEALEDLRARLPFGSRPSGEDEVEYLYSIVKGGEGGRKGIRRFHLIYADATEVGRTLVWELLLDAFEKDVELLVGEKAKGRVFVHAGVVEWRGRAIILPGRSYSGKSTLVAELVRAGAKYYSDEFAVLDEKGFVHPYQRPIALRRSNERSAQKYTPNDLDRHPVMPPIPVGCVLLTGFRNGAHFRPKRLSPGTACLEILRHTLSARSQPELVLPVLRAVTQDAAIYKTYRGQASEIALSVLALADDSARGVKIGESAFSRSDWPSRS